MEVKIERFNNDQNSLPAKELQKFLDKIQGVMLIPKDKILEYPILCLLMSEETYVNFKDYNIHKAIAEMLDNKYPILSIRLDDNSNFIGLSIIDKKSRLKFNFPDQPISDALLTFLEARNNHDKICLMIGFFRGSDIIFDPTVKSNTLLILDGYVFE